MAVLTAKTTRRSTRLRVEIPVNVTSLDRRRPFAESCVVLVVSAQGCGFRSERPLQLETPILLNGLPGGGSVTAWVASCIPLGGDGTHYLIGAALYTQGNVWGIVDPPEDWKSAGENAPVGPNPAPAAEPQLKINRQPWPYNLFSESAESGRGRK